jgi:hypothetical protein
MWVSRQPVPSDECSGVWGKSYDGGIGLTSLDRRNSPCVAAPLALAVGGAATRR